MYPFLLSLSLIATAIGVFAIGFGIPNRDFTFGDMLIIVGTVAIVGGMIMFGLAAAVRQLRRIADGMGPRPATRRPPVPAGGHAPPGRRRFRTAPMQPPPRARGPLRVFPIRPKRPWRPAIAIPVPPSHGPCPPWRPTRPRDHWSARVRAFSGRRA